LPRQVAAGWRLDSLICFLLKGIREREHVGNHEVGRQEGLKVAESKEQFRSGVEVDGAAEMLTLLAYAVNLRSRSGASRAQLKAAATAALAALAR
jgi:hypothetical protein